ncbi:unnamed protein product [Leptosia nina]|uniref:Uncharacterized protein n=1 Tax=Leptosia nina TaxID=320188 RepID=A0AAV1JEY0_9NEOP
MKYLEMLLCHNSIAQGYLSTEQNEEFDEINADVRKTTDCEVDEQDTLGGSQTKKVYIAGSDDKLYKFINELVQNKVKNELTVYFYFYKHKKFSYISSFPTSFDSLKSVLCKYAHYFYENKTADINSIEQFVDNLIVLSRTKGKRFVGASRNKDHPINISDEDDYRIYTKNKGYYEFDVPETQHYKGKDINVETVNVGNYNDFDSKLDTEDLDSQHTNKQNDIFPTVHKNIIDDTEVIQNDKTRLNIKNSNSDAMNTGIYEFDITGGEKYKQKDIIFDTNYISGGMDGDKYNDNNDYDVITNKNNDAYEFNVPNSKNYKGNNIIVDIVEPESYLDKQGEENIVTGYKIPPTTYGMSDVNNRAGIDSLPTQLYDTGGLGKTDKEYEFNAPCSNYKQKDINVDIFKSNLNNNEILSNQNTGYNEFDVQSPSYKGKDINVDILNGFPRQEDNFRNKLVEPVRHLYKDAHISSYFKGDATNRGYALDTNLNELSSLINKNSPQSESDGTLIEYPATSTKQELTLSNGNAIDNEPLQTEIGSYAPYSAQVNVPHENTYPIREDYDGSTLKNELRDGMDTNIKEFIPYYSSSDVLDTEKPTLVNKNTVTNKGEYTMQDLPCHTHLGEQPNDHTHRTVYWPKGHFHLTYHLDEPYSTICEKSDTMDNTDLKIPCSNYYIPDSYSFRKNKLNSIPYLGGKTYGYNEYSIKNPPWPNNIDINLAHMNQRKQALSDLKTQPLRTSESFVGNLRDRFESDLPEIDKHRYSFRGPPYSNNYLSDYKGNYGRKPFRLQSQPCSKNYNHQVMKAKHDLNDLHQGQAYYSQYEGIYDNNSQQKNMFRNLHKSSYGVMSDKTNMYKPKNPFHVCNKIPCQRNVHTVPICTAKNIIATPNSYIPVSKPSSLQIPDSTFDKLKYSLYPTQMTYDQSYSTNTQDLYKSHIHSPIPRSSLKSYITSYQSDKSKIPIQQSNRYHSNYFDTYEVPRIWGLQKMLPNSFNHQLYSGYSNDFGKNQMYLPTINVSNNIKSKQTQSYDQIPNSLNISPYMSDADQKSHLPCYNEILADFQSNSPSIEYQQNPLYELHNYIGKPCHAIMGNLPYKVQANSFQGWKATVLSQQPCHNYLPSFTQKLPRFSSPSNYHNTNLPQQTNTPCFRSYEPCVQLERPQSETERGVSQKNAYSYNTPLKVRQNLPYSTYTKPFMVNSKICTPNFNPAITDIIPQKDNTFINQPLITTPVRYDTDIPKSICPLAKVNMQNKLALWNRNDISRSIFADDFICKDKLRESYGSFTPFFPPYALNPIQWHESKKDIKSNVVADNLDNTFTSMYVPSSLSYPQSYSNNIAYNPYIYSPNPSLQEISYQNRKSTLFKPTVDVTRPENISPLTSLSSHFITEPKLSTSPLMVAKPSIPCTYSQNTIADAQLEEPCNYNIKKPSYTTTSYNIILNKDIRSETLKQQNANKFHQSSRKPIKNLYTLINSKPGQFASFKTSHPNLPCDNYLSQFEPLVYKYGQGMLPIRNRQDYLPFKYNSEKEKSSFYKPGVTYNTRINQIAGTKICPFSGLGENIPYSPSFQNVIGTIDVDNEPQSSTYFGPSSGHHLNQHPCYEQAYSVKPYKPFYNRNPYIQDSFDLTGKPTMSLYPQPALIDSTIPSVSNNYLRKTCQNSINLSRFDYLSNGPKIFTDPKQVSKYSAHYPSIDNYLNPFSLNSKSTYNSLQESYLPSNYYDVNFPNTDNDNNYLNSYLALGTNKPCIHIMSNKPGLYNKQVNEDTFNPSICDYSSAKYKENIPKLTINNIKEIFKSKLNNAIPTALPTKYFDDNFNDPNVHAQDTIKIDLGDIAVAKYDDKNRYMIKTDNPKIDLIVWKSKVKTLNAKLIINVKDMPVVNFMPVVRDMSIDDGYNIAKDYVKRFFGEPMIVNGRYTAYDPYAVVLNSKNSYVLWPAICNCGCKVCGCKCGQ